MLTSPDATATTGPSRGAAPVAVVLALWFALVFLLGARGEFVRPPGTPPLPILVGFLTPLIACVAAYRVSGSFREFVLSLDLRLVAGVQAWRFGGLWFIALAVHGVLPGAFAWRAGLGDLAVGLAAPWVLLSLIRRPGFAGSPLFLAWNLFGMLDLFVAMGTGALSSLQAGGGAGAATALPMAQLPLVLVPAYFVPVFFLLHIAALLQWRRWQAAGNPSATRARESQSIA